MAARINKKWIVICLEVAESNLTIAFRAGLHRTSTPSWIFKFLVSVQRLLL